MKRITMFHGKVKYQTTYQNMPMASASFSITRGQWSPLHHHFFLPSGNQTWQWKLDHSSMIFLYVYIYIHIVKPKFIGDFPLPCLMTPKSVSDVNCYNESYLSMFLECQHLFQYMYIYIYIIMYIQWYCSIVTDPLSMMFLSKSPCHVWIPEATIDYP